MNKLTKAGIATAAGIALLMGGAGTLAYWNDQADLLASDTEITAGRLDIVGVTGAGWTNGSGDPINIANYRIVPGETLTYNATVEVSVVGDTLEAEMGLTGGSITAASASAADVALAGFLSNNVTISASGTGVTANGTVYTITTAADEIDVTVTVTFPNGAAGVENAAMDGAVDLSALAVQLKQV